MERHPVFRVVTGHDEHGRSIVSSAGAPPTVVSLENVPGTVFHELWATDRTPACVDAALDPTLGPLSLKPPPGGTRARIVDIPPDGPDLLAPGAQVKSVFDEIGDPSASTLTAASPHPLMHRTRSIDYGVVLEGEIVMVLDRGEVLLRAGDVVIQRGTNHAWANRSSRVTRMLFVLVDGALGTGPSAAPAAESSR